MTNTQPAPITIDPVIILSTGRCGSTMVSEMLNLHPDLLSVSEFFAALGPAAFAWKNPDGNQIWKLCSEQNALLRALLENGLMVSEYIYPFDQPGARHTPLTVPPISLMTLPHLTAQHDDLCDELENFVRSQPRMPPGDHYRLLFGFLVQKFGRKTWVERSGCSLLYTGRILQTFPEARIIHVYRDGRDTAMSMSNHHVFRAGVAAALKFRVDLRARIRSPRRQALQSALEALLLRFFDVNKLVKDTPLSLAEFGAFWNDMIVASHDVLKELPAERLLNLKFEDVQQSPREKISELIRFIDPSLENESWLSEVETIPQAARSKFTTLPEETQQAVTRACLPGLQLLGYTDDDAPAATGGSACPFNQTITAVTSIMQRTWQPPRADGSRPRAFHDKTHACLRAEFHVEPPQGEQFRHGLFSTQKTYPAIVRLSSSFSSDLKPDQRGFAIKLDGVEGDVCKDAPPGQQDFVLVNQPFFGVADAEETLSLFTKLDGSGEITLTKLLVPRFIFPSIRLSRIRWHYLAAMHRAGWNHLRCRDLFRFTYYSATPYQLGKGAVQYQLRPDPGAPRIKVRGKTFRQRLQSVLDQGPVTLGFYIQPRYGESEPLDDASKIWKTPVIRTGRLVIPPQDVMASIELGDSLAFSPWNTLQAHTPLGSINEARRLAYRKSAELRKGNPVFPK